MDNNEAIIQIILDTVKQKYPNDVDLVCCYGSYVNGTATEKSDVDFYFVPKTDKAWELSDTFILDGIGYDFWGIKWERLEKMATFDDTFVSLVAEAKILYSNSPKTEERFCELQQRINKTVNSPVCTDMLSKALVHLNDAQKHYFELIANNNQKNKLYHAGAVLLTVSDAVFLMNNQYLKYGTKKHLGELSALQILPDNFINHYKNIINQNNIENSCYDFILSAKNLYNELENKINQKKNPKDNLPGLYEEISSNWNKLYTACDNNNPGLAFITGICLQNTLDDVLHECRLQPIDLLSQYDANNLNKYKKAAESAEKQFLFILNEYNIPIKRYDSVFAFKDSYMLSRG